MPTPSADACTRRCAMADPITEALDRRHAASHSHDSLQAVVLLQALVQQLAVRVA